jgi:cysteine desulfurase
VAVGPEWIVVGAKPCAGRIRVNRVADMPRVYLDHQSGTPVHPEVLEAMRPYWTEAFGSPMSLHQLGLRARQALVQARARCAQLIHAEAPDDIVFTAGATEAANLAVKGAAWAGQRRGNHLVVTATEHPAVMRSVEWLEQQGFTATRVPVDGVGCVEPEAIRRALTERTVLVCVHHANHDIGTIQPIRQIASITAEQGVPLFVDASASGGWAPIDVQAMGVSLLSLAPHRFYGPKGVGVLYRHRRARLTSLIHGGNQEHGLRAGTENVPAIVGAGAAAELAWRELGRRADHTQALQRRLWDELQRRIERLRLNGPEPGPQRLRTNLNVSFEFIEAEGLVLLMDLHGTALHSGPSCVTRDLKIPPALVAIGLDPDLAKSAVLFSLGEQNTDAELDQAVGTLVKAVAKLRSMSPAWEDFQARRGFPSSPNSV